MDIELVCEGLQFPEGPIAMADGSIVLVDIQRKTLTRITPDGKREAAGPTARRSARTARSTSPTTAARSRTTSTRAC
jgi:sugar lactone lactonase YvrE